MTDQRRDALDILLIEDNPGDVRLIREALREAAVAHRLAVVSDGDAARALLGSLGSTEDRPDVILLDLDLPRLDGRDLLVLIRSDDALRDVPVVILTSSAAEEDAQRSLELDADHFVTKPLEIEAYVALAGRLRELALRRQRG